MPFISKRKKLKLTKEEENELLKISKSRMGSKNKIERAKMLLNYYSGNTISYIAKLLQTNRPKIERCIDKALVFGALPSLNDLPRKGRPAQITREAKTWFLSIACCKPKDLNLAAEFWTTTELSKYIQKKCTKAGHPSLKKISRGTVSKILNKSNIKPHKINYYIEKRDPDFEEKMANILYVYKEIEIIQANENEPTNTAYLSYDEKPGLQAIENTSKDLPPVSGKNKTWQRDHEYKRHGTLSLLAGIDLLNGKVYGKVFDRHRSKEFVEFLKYINNSYPSELKLKIILDNHSAHISKETKEFLKTLPNRFEFIFTPKHASWLNLIEVFFSKMARGFLRGIRVKSKDELKKRILKFLKETNQSPSVYRWKWKMDEINIY